MDPNSAEAHQQQQIQFAETVSRPGVTERTPDSVKLFVGQISRTSSEADIIPVLQPFGNLQEFTIVREKGTGQSKGCGFAIFSNKHEAHACIQALNNAFTMPGMTNPMQVSVANGEADRMADNKLFVGMLPKTSNEDEVRSIFQAYGAIEEVHVLRDKATSESKGCGFVKFEMRSAALAAIEALNGVYHMHGAPQPIVVKFAENKKKDGQGAAAVAGRPMAYGVPPGYPVAAMQQARPQIPPQQVEWGQYQAWAAQPAQWGQPAVQYGHDMTAYSMYGQPQMQHQPVAIPQAVPSQDDKKEGPPGANLFIYHIPSTFTDPDLTATFQPFGTVVSAKVFCDKVTGESRGFGFVSFDTPASAEQAIAHMNGFQIGSKRLKVQHKKVGGAGGGRPY